MAPASQLPTKPDFAAIEAAAGGSSENRSQFFELIGSLVYNWSNNESMFIYVMMLLLGTDQTSAVLVFGTLNTTRARIDLVQRLAKAKLTDPEIAGRLKRIIARFEAGTRIRNDFNHSMFMVDAAGAITHTRAMRIEEKRGAMRFGAERAVDAARIAKMREAVRAMSELNRDIWDFLPVLERHIRRRTDAPPAA